MFLKEIEAVLERTCLSGGWDAGCGVGLRGGVAGCVVGICGMEQ